MPRPAIQKSDQRFTCANATLHSNIRYIHPLWRDLYCAQILPFPFPKTKHTYLLSRAPKLLGLPKSWEFPAQNTNVLSCDGTNTFQPMPQCFLPERPSRTRCVPVYAKHAFWHGAYLQPSARKKRYLLRSNNKLLSSSYRHYTAPSVLLSILHRPFHRMFHTICKDCPIIPAILCQGCEFPLIFLPM